ncbi:GAF and ANTAR domain-containing protein [Jiangella anatolica]|uniref:Antitermination regulator n=1 Tax=Jiangella anatolica TaxID=2670374 RepID=A0A2W2B3Y8_9ACTN|nr:GAF and ANTAR domain-containing protein [Jiangella anatolica]PZF82141.1 antitermination regulator [Jiangella anatolica]
MDTPSEALPEPEPELLTRQLAEAAARLYLQPDVHSTVTAVVEQGVDIIGGDAASLTLLGRRGAHELTVASSDRAERADRAQLELAEGPSPAALTARAPVIVDDIATEPRWPRWQDAVADAGFRSLLALPLELGPHYSGALVVLWTLPEQPADRHLAVARLLLRHAAIAIVDARRSSTLREAIDARYQIGLAQGILMERYGLDATQSFELLRRYSRDNNVKLSQVAAGVVRTRALPDARGE